MGSIKDRNCLDLTEAEDTDKRCKNTQNCTKKIFTTQIITMVWSLTLSQTFWIPKALDLRKHHYKQSWWRWWNSSWAISNHKRWCFKVLHSICQLFWKTQQWPQDWKRSVFFLISKKGFQIPENAQTTTQLYSSHMLAKECLKFSKPGFSNTWTMNFQIFKLDLEKAEE